MKIYIIGAPGSGKTTLSKELSNKYNIPYYELDLLVFDDEDGHIRRTDEEINKLFTDILNKDSYIIEDVGRSKFIEGIKDADIVYYMNINKYIVYYRVVNRWFKQLIGKEEYNYPPTLANLFDFIKITKGYYKKENKKKETINKNCKKVKYLRKKDIKELNSL